MDDYANLDGGGIDVGNVLPRTQAIFPGPFLARPWQPHVPLPPYRATCIGREGSGRRRAEAFIEAVFRRDHDARIASHYPELLCLENRTGDLIGVCGIRMAEGGPLFLESYLDMPVEQAAGAALHRKVQRERIVEIGNLATDGRGSSLSMIEATALLIIARGFDVAVLTATSKLRRVFSHVGIATTVFGGADPRRLADGGGSWGTYYSGRPLLLVGVLPVCLADACRRSPLMADALK